MPVSTAPTEVYRSACFVCGTRRSLWRALFARRNPQQTERECERAQTEPAGLLASTELRNQNKCDEKPDCRRIVFACPALPACQPASRRGQRPEEPSRAALLPKRLPLRLAACCTASTRAHDAKLLSNQSLFVLPLPAREANERNSHATAA